MASVFYCVKLLWEIMKQVFCKDTTLIFAMSRGELGDLFYGRGILSIVLELAFTNTVISSASQHRPAQHGAQCLWLSFVGRMLPGPCSSAWSGGQQWFENALG